TERYPYSGPELHLARAEVDETEPAARLAVTDDLRRSRLTVFFRPALAAPHLVWFVLWTVLAWPAAALNWLAALFLGRSPRPRPDAGGPAQRGSIRARLRRPGARLRVRSHRPLSVQWAEWIPPAR